MSQFPETRISLILRLSAAEDAAAWREFAQLYAPAVYSIAKRRGLQTADAEDFVQELLLAVARAAGRWSPDPDRARFRTWLYRVAANLLADHFQQRARQLKFVQDEDDQSQAIIDPQTESITAEFELDFRRAVFHKAAAIVRQRVSQPTWQAFAATAIDQAPAAAVSRQLGISVGSVYVARSRTMKLLREEIDRLLADAAARESEEVERT